MSCLSVCFAISASKTEKSSFCKEFAKKLKVAYLQRVKVVICIENPRVPGSIPGRGTTSLKTLIRDGRGFLLPSEAGKPVRLKET